MTRWISSAICTAAIIALCFFLPVWNFQKTIADSVQMNEDDTSISVVSVVKKRQAQQSQIVQKQSIPNEVVQPKKQPETKPSVPAEKQVVSERIQTEQVPEKAITEPIAEETTEENTSFAEENSAESLGEVSETGENNASTVQNGEGSEKTEKIEVSEEVKKMSAAYKKYALTRIAAKKAYPYKARTQGIEGKVKVQIVIATDGSVKEAEIIEKSDSELLNAACLEAIKKAAPFKKMKEGMSEMTIIFVMDFALQS